MRKTTRLFCTLCLLVGTLFCLYGCSKPTPTVLPDVGELLSPLSASITLDQIATYESEKYGSADHTQETYQNGNIACIFGEGLRKYIFANEKLHSFYYYGVDSFPASLEQIKASIGEPATVTDDVYMLWNATFNGTPVTIVYSKNPVNEAKTSLSFELK